MRTRRSGDIINPVRSHNGLLAAYVDSSRKNFLLVTIGYVAAPPFGGQQQLEAQRPFAMLIWQVEGRHTTIIVREFLGALLAPMVPKSGTSASSPGLPALINTWVV